MCVGLPGQLESARELFRFNGAVADAQTAIRETEAKVLASDAPADVDAAEAMLRDLESVSAELAANGRRVEAVEVRRRRVPDEP